MTTDTQAVQTWTRSAAPSYLAGNWEKFSIILIIGYLCMFRSFSYLGLPWWHIYIGELALAAFLFFSPSTPQGAWLLLAQRIRRLDRFRTLVLLLLAFGGFEALRGMARGYSALTVLRDTGFNYYPLYFFLGIWLGLRNFNFLRQVIRSLAWFNGCYGACNVLLLSRIPWSLPGTGDAASPVPLFSEPSGAAAVALLGLIVFEPRLQRVWHLIALNAFVLLGLQVRGEWLGFAVGVIVFAWLTRKLKYLATATVPLFVLIGLMYVANISLQSPLGRGDNVGASGTRISAYYLIARAIAPISKDLAGNLAPDEEVRFAAGTADWRLLWWANIWGAVHANWSSALFGLSYGYPIADLNPLLQPGTFIQTPHSVFFYTLGFSGWLGVLLFTLLQVEIAGLLWRAYRITREPFGLVCYAALLAMAVFEPSFEAPYGAIPFFLLVGAAAAPALLSVRKSALPNDGRELPPALPAAQPA